MRVSESSLNHKSAARLLGAFLLASVATGCSSDSSRFGGLFSSRTDNVTTNSIPRRTDTVNGQIPVPRREVQNGPAAQPVATADVSYEPVNTSQSGVSGARASVTPVMVESVQRGASPMSEPQVIVEEPVIINPAKTAVRTGKAGWAVSANSPEVHLKSGDTMFSLSRRYGVPEKELLRANGLKSASAAKAGQVIVIPTYGATGTMADAKVAADQAADGKTRNLPTPANPPDEQVAVLPATTSRDKARTAGGKIVNAEGETAVNEDTGIYVVKSGDSLARIAKMHSTTVDALKEANGFDGAQLRIGQKIKLSGPAETNAALADTDDNATGSVPKASKIVAAPSTNEPEVATQSVDEVEQSAGDEAAPEATGISKYRWPVKGAVVAAYGANVEGERNSGIDISVPEGTAVKAAENGVVIYSGSGLKELGNTVLIRHDDGTVTVYGNAASLSVQRGQKVIRGQTIAASGMTGGARQPKLHFEVRKNASPVNPMTFLE